MARAMNTLRGPCRVQNQVIKKGSYLSYLHARGSLESNRGKSSKRIHVIYVIRV